MPYCSASQSSRIGRRSFLALAATGFGALAAGCSRTGDGLRPNQKQLNIYSWADYLHPDTIPEFERRYGIRVVYDTFASNESLLAKLQAGAGDYDIVVPTSYMVSHLKRLNLVAPVDHARVPSLVNIIERFRNPAFDPGLHYSVPYTWGTTGIGYDLSLFSARFASGSDWPEDWDVFWNNRFTHRITLLDDARETIGMSLKKAGHSYNTKSETEISAAVADLKMQKPLIMCYTSDQVITQLAAGDSWIALGYSGDIYQAAKENRNVRYAIPRSGTSIWMDNMCIPKTAPHVDNAYKWINFMLEPQIAAATASYTRYATPNSAALKLISADMRNDANLYPPEKVMDRCEELGDIGNLIFYYDRMWTELKCT